ncbi:hypothetical protein JVU11DRAFT_7124 [Chiua virens]|nr:hypothetical protein JVU11DRAFT_7124 [Chiua virens]
MEKDCELTRVLGIPHIQKHLAATTSHPAQQLWQGMLLYENNLHQVGEDAEDWICSECLHTLAKDRLPKYALANKMWIGGVPFQLSMLTFPEELLIACHYPKVIKLFPKEGRNVQASNLQRAIHGNVMLYNMNTDNVVWMLEGQLMPQLPISLALCVIAMETGSG